MLAVSQGSIEAGIGCIRGGVIPGLRQRLCGRGCSLPAQLVGYLLVLVVRPSCEPEPDVEDGGGDELVVRRIRVRTR